MKSRSLVLVILIVLLAPAVAAPPQDIFDLLRKGDIPALKAIIERNPDLLDARDRNGDSLLHRAAEAGDASLIRYLVDKGARPDLTGARKQTPLHLAAINDHGEAVTALLERKAALEARDDYQRTPLIVCARERGQAATGRRLIEAGADVNAEDRFGSSALELAAWRGKGEFIDLLIEKGARLPEPGDKWHGLLQMAASQGLETLFRRLAEKVPDLKAAAGQGPLRAAAEGGSAAIVGLLLDKGLDPAAADRFGWTPLHYAARDGRTDAAKILIAKGAPLNVRTIMGQTAYNIATERKMKTVTSLLAGKGAETGPLRFPVLEADFLGQTPPGGKPEIFGLGIISSIWGLHSTAVFSPDGNEVYWAPMITVPGELYSHGGLLMMKRVGGRWTPPDWAPFSGPGLGDDVPFFSTDGKRIYFISRRPLPGESAAGSEKIWFTDRTAAGWDVPRPLDRAVNEHHMHWEFSLDKAGDLYFAGQAPDSLGMNDIYLARFVDGKYEKPVNAGTPVNSAAGEESPFISPDGSYLLFSRQYDLWVCFRGEGGGWSEPVDLGPEVNSPAVELCPVVTADGQYLFFLSQRDGESHAYWVPAGVIEKLRPGRRGE
jgi:ankyrin repeat protein